VASFEGSDKNRISQKRRPSLESQSFLKEIFAVDFSISIRIDWENDEVWTKGGVVEIELVDMEISQALVLSAQITLQALRTRRLSSVRQNHKGKEDKTWRIFFEDFHMAAKEHLRGRILSFFIKLFFFSWVP
jgi:hypothetical protein